MRVVGSSVRARQTSSAPVISVSVGLTPAADLGSFLRWDKVSLWMLFSALQWHYISVLLDSSPLDLLDEGLALRRHVSWLYARGITP